jgi:hypothetical protein
MSKVQMIVELLRVHWYLDIVSSLRASPSKCGQWASALSTATPSAPRGLFPAPGPVRRLLVPVPAFFRFAPRSLSELPSNCC